MVYLITDCHPLLHFTETQPTVWSPVTSNSPQYYKSLDLLFISSLLPLICFSVHQFDVLSPPPPTLPLSLHQLFICSIFHHPFRTICPCLLVHQLVLLCLSILSPPYTHSYFILSISFLTPSFSTHFFL